MRARFHFLAVTAVTAALAATLLVLPATGAERALRVGFGERIITPVGAVPAAWSEFFTPHPVTGVWGEPYTDLNGDNCYSGATNEDAEPVLDGEAPEGAAPEPFVDQPWNSAGDAYETTAIWEVDGVRIYGDPDSTGKWDGVWANAGFGAKCTLGKLDETMANAVVLDDGEHTVAMVSLDVVGLFNIEVQRTRRELTARYPDMTIDELVVSSTHTHEGVDTMGYWGQLFAATDGKFPAYQAFLRSQMIDAIHEAYESRELAAAKFAQGAQPLGIRDSRPPFVVDGEVTTAQFVRPDDDSVIGTLVNWSNHPEALGSRNPYVSSDFPHYTREYLEQAYPGSQAVFFTGAVGGLQTPLGVDVEYVKDGVLRNDTEPNIERTKRIGDLVAMSAIDAIDVADTVQIDVVESQRREFYLHSDNNVLRALNATGIFDIASYIGGDSYGSDESQHTPGIRTDESGPQIKTEMVAVRIGPAMFLTVPGELSPELELGGYGRDEDQTFPHWNGGEGTYGACPDADTGRPHEPVIREQFDGDEYHFILGLGQDELGYIIPGYDFHLINAPGDGIGDAGYPGAGPGVVPLGGLEYEACGEGHYEETVSISSVFAPWVACVAGELAGNDVWTTETACTRENMEMNPYGLRTEDLAARDDWVTALTARQAMIQAIEESHGHSHLPVESVVNAAVEGPAVESPAAATRVVERPVVDGEHGHQHGPAGEVHSH